MTASAAAQPARTVSAGRPGHEPATGATDIAAYRGWEQVERVLEASGLGTAWEELLGRDPVAGFYQTPLWCVTWYRCFREEFEPFVLAARNGRHLVGLAPLARERTSGRLLFAGDGMADYRDFLCEAGRRRDLVPRFLARMREASGASRLVIGQTQPDSETTELAREWASGPGACRVIVRTHPCRRYRFGAPEELAALFRKKTLRQALAHYRRLGDLRFRRVRDLREWEHLKPLFFRQQCLRQAFAGRELSFEDPLKQRFYSRLFESLAPETHLSVLWASDRPISFMFCFTHRGVLYYGAPSFDLLEARHSPGLLHLLEAMQHCGRQGYREVDFTLGSSSFKERLANHSVQLPTVYLYRRPWPYWVDRIKGGAADRAKACLRAWTGSEEAWESVKERAAAVAAFGRKAARTPLRRAVRWAARRLWSLFYDAYTAEIFRLSPDRLTPVDGTDEAAGRCEFRDNRIEDFLTLEGAERDRLSVRLQEAVRRIGRGHTLHTVLVDGRLAHYGWSYWPAGSVSLPETGTAFPVPAASVSLYDCYTCVRYRGRRLYPANLARIVTGAFKDGAVEAYIVCESRNGASRRGIERVGFRRCAVHRFRRVLGWSRRRVEESA